MCGDLAIPMAISSHNLLSPSPQESLRQGCHLSWASRFLKKLDLWLLLSHESCWSTSRFPLVSVSFSNLVLHAFPVPHPILFCESLTSAKFLSCVNSPNDFSCFSSRILMGPGRKETLHPGTLFPGTNSVQEFACIHMHTHTVTGLHIVSVTQ